MKYTKSNLEYEVDDDKILHMRVDLKRCASVNEKTNYMACNQNFTPIMLQRGDETIDSGLKVQVLVVAPRTGKTTHKQKKKHIAEMWPELEKEGQALLKELAKGEESL